ncbi:hypothetical protein SeLEV6574_g06201, partial [Synchytrium endobioticum]
MTSVASAEPTPTAVAPMASRSRVAAGLWTATKATIAITKFTAALEKEITTPASSRRDVKAREGPSFPLT